MSMNPTANNATGENSHSYPAYDYPVGIGTGLVAVKDGVIKDFGTATRKLMGNLNNTQHWPEFISGAQNSGNVISIDHGDGEFTCYLHVSPYDVSTLRGKAVKKGQIFHKSGHNGWSTGPHLHFEVWENGVRIDPGAWLNNIGGDMIGAEDVGPMRIVMSEVEGWDGRKVHAGEYDKVIASAWVGKPWEEFINNGWVKQKTHRFALVEKIDALNKTVTAKNTEITQLKNQIAAMQQPTVLTKGYYEVK
jgi:hypothetical protein